MIKLIELIQQHDGDMAATILLTGRLRQNPSLKGILVLLQIHVNETEGQLQHNLQQAAEILKSLLQSKPAYQCNQCGYQSRSLYWQCPSCQKWDTIKPILGIEGE